MTDINSPAIDMAAILASFSAWEAKAEKLVPENKARLFALLSSADITRVTVTFDGEGDSGQIEDVVAFNGDELIELPDGQIELLELKHGADEPVIHNVPAAQAIETLCYDLLRQTHCGWENNDGAYGDFTFDIAAGTIALDYNGRFTDTQQFAHEW
jgi:hypothetical protein